MLGVKTASLVNIVTNTSPSRSRKSQVKHQKIVFFWDVDKDKIPKYHCEESDKVDGVSCKIGFHYVHKYFYATDVFSLNDPRVEFHKKI